MSDLSASCSCASIWCRGSNTTIARLQQEFRGEQLLATRTPVAGSHGAASIVASMMETPGASAAKAADAHTEAMRSEFEATTRKIVQARDKAEQDLRDMRLEYQAREGQISDAKESIRSLQTILSEKRGHWAQTCAALEAQHTEGALEAEKRAREVAGRYNQGRASDSGGSAS